MLFNLQIFSGGVYPPSATLRTISFSISNSFWYYSLIEFLTNESISDTQRDLTFLDILKLFSVSRVNFVKVQLSPTSWSEKH